MVARTASTPSRRRSGTSCSAGGSSSIATASGCAAPCAPSRVGKLSGAVGTYGNVDPRVEKSRCERLGLDVEPAATQVIRATATRPCSRRSPSRLQPRPLRDRDPPPARSEVREAEEPFAVGQKGSRRCRTSGTRSSASASPASRASCARTRSSASRTSRSGTSATSRTRRPSASCSRLDALADYMLDRFTWVVEGLQVYPERMPGTSRRRSGSTFSRRVLLALVEAGMSRDDAYERCSETRSAPGTRGAAAPTQLAEDEEVTRGPVADALGRAFDLDDALSQRTSLRPARGAPGGGPRA